MTAGSEPRTREYLAGRGQYWKSRRSFGRPAREADLCVESLVCDLFERHTACHRLRRVIAAAIFAFLLVGFGDSTPATYRVSATYPAAAQM